MQHPSPKHAEKIYQMLKVRLPGEHKAHTRTFFTMIRRAAQEAFKITIRVTKINKEIDGDYFAPTRSIRLAKGQSTFISSLCHELCHVYCTDNKLFINYHARDPEDPRCKRLHNKAERYVDKMGEQVFKKFFPNEEYPVCEERKGE